MLYITSGVVGAQDENNPLVPSNSSRNCNTIQSRRERSKLLLALAIKRSRSQWYFYSRRVTGSICWVVAVLLRYEVRCSASPLHRTTKVFVRVGGRSWDWKWKWNLVLALGIAGFLLLYNTIVCIDDDGILSSQLIRSWVWSVLCCSLFWQFPP